MIRVRFHFVAEESMNFLLAICFKDKTVLRIVYIIYNLRINLYDVIYFVFNLFMIIPTLQKNTITEIILILLL